MKIRTYSALTAVAALAWGVPALAVATLTLDNGVDPAIVCVDNTACDGNALEGVVTYNAAVGSNWIVNVSTGITYPILGSVAQAYMDLNSVNVSLASGAMTITFTSTGYSPYEGIGTSAVGGTLSGGAGSTATFATYMDPTNSGLLTNLIAGNGPFAPGAFSGTTNGLVSSGTMFSLTQVATIVHAGRGSSSWNYEFKVPEPGTLALFGLGLVGLGFSARRRRRSC